MLFICYPKCSTCQKAKKWLDAQKIEYTERNIVDVNPTCGELKEWYSKSGFPLKKFFNTSGLLYKEMKLKDKLPAMSLPPCHERRGTVAASCHEWYAGETPAADRW